MHKMYTVHMVNFDMNKGSFATLEAAIEHAKELGFECSILVSEDGKRPLHICNIKPY